MGKETRFGTFEELLEGRPDNLIAICIRLKEIILDVHPDAVEVVRLGYNAASYGVGSGKMSESHTYITPHKNYVNLGFYFGALLDDPTGILEGTGKKLRHIKVRTLEDANNPALRSLIEAALLERISTLGR